MTTTTKYELTDADRERLDAIAQKASGKPKVDDTAWNIAHDWFATLPVVSREVVEQALGEATESEIEDAAIKYTSIAGIRAAMKRTLSQFVCRRRAMLDDATVEPPKVALSGPSREWLAKAADAEDASRSVSVGGMAVDTEMYVAPVEPTPEPQPAIDVVAELAELRRLIDLMLGNARLLELQGECLDDFRRRLNALESAAQRKPWWRWW